MMPFYCTYILKKFLYLGEKNRTALKNEMLFQYIEPIHNNELIVSKYYQMRSKRKLQARNCNGLRVVFQSIAATIKISLRHNRTPNVYVFIYRLNETVKVVNKVLNIF